MFVLRMCEGVCLGFDGCGVVVLYSFCVSVYLTLYVCLSVSAVGMCSENELEDDSPVAMFQLGKCVCAYVRVLCV